MKAKVVRRKTQRKFGRSLREVEVYDIYEGVPRLIFPFLTKWVYVTGGLSYTDARDYVWKYYATVTDSKIISAVE